MAAHGIPRYTKDLDVWLACSPENAAKVVAALDAPGRAQDLADAEALDR